MFKSASDGSFAEIEERKNSSKVRLPFGITFLDDALRGIRHDDLVLIGAPSGVGKTQLCCIIAQANIKAGKRVHYIALEAGKFEIERRIKFQWIAEAYYSQPNRPFGTLSYDRWLDGEYLNEMTEIELAVANEFEKEFAKFFIYYKADKFGVHELLEQVSLCSSMTDLIIVDHVHYFDFDDDNENRAIKEIAKAARSLALDHGKPIILVAHLRKRDRFNQEMVAGLDEFHGSSDLTKIATKVITVSPGALTGGGTYETFFRAPKNRNNGGVTRFLGRLVYDMSANTYKNEYRLGLAGQMRDREFEDLNSDSRPEWAKNASDPGSGFYPNVQRQPAATPNVGSKKNSKYVRTYNPGSHLE